MKAKKFNAVYFDMEVQNLPDDWDRKQRLSITCAVAHAVMKSATEPYEINKYWWAGMQDMQYESRPLSLDQLSQGIQANQVPVNDEMSALEVEQMLDELLQLLDPDKLPLEWPDETPSRLPLFTWAGVSFDFPCLASNIPHRTEDIIGMTERSYDPCFQFIRTLGWPIALDKIARTMIDDGKPEGMDGAKAAEMWPKEAARVLEYCANDTRITRRVVEAMMAEHQVRWKTQRGKTQAKPLRRWSSVAMTMKLEEPNRSWMDNGDKFRLENLIGWMCETR